MTYKTVEVDVEVYLDDWTDRELVDEMTQRGYTCVKTGEGLFENQDWQMLLEMIDNLPRSWEIDRLRDKVLKARHQIE
jgi:hypothetical protein